MSTVHTLSALLSTLVLAGVLIVLAWGSRGVTTAIDELEATYRALGFSTVRRWRSLVMMGAALHARRQDADMALDLHIGRRAVAGARPDMGLLDRPNPQVANLFWQLLTITQQAPGTLPAFALRRRHTGTDLVWKKIAPAGWGLTPYRTGDAAFDEQFEVLVGAASEGQALLPAATAAQVLRALAGPGCEYVVVFCSPHRADSLFVVNPPKPDADGAVIAVLQRIARQVGPARPPS